MDVDRMEYRNLGPTGLKVSLFSFGNMTASVNPEAESWNYEIIDKCIRAGVNFFDSAEIYGDGVSESILGKNIKQGGWDRDDLIISLKLMCTGKLAGIQGLSSKHIRQGVRNSLNRMQMDYADVFYLHRFDCEVPLYEQIRTVNQLLEEDKFFYWGSSMFTPQQLLECYKICDKYGFHYPVVEQCEYNMLARKNVEVDLVPIFDRYHVGTTVWGPLSGGLLTGKYNDGNIPQGSRIDTMKHPLVQADFQEKINKQKEKAVQRLQGLGALAEELGVTQSQLSIAWVMKNPDVSTAIVGATKVSQIEENLGALDAYAKLTPEILARIETILDNRPTPGMNFRNWKPFPPRR